ncbi:hypothetical protein MRB53_026680 [Persea americana]|uniref:Uncharacterized protein n=1 Tax=Persea americana TaxID=3435 RepID=A0ACC2LJY3_PERAE|nr:hypothetical protein MRB53_026680 [Persea americana]
MEEEAGVLRPTHLLRLERVRAPPDRHLQHRHHLHHLVWDLSSMGQPVDGGLDPEETEDLILWWVITLEKWSLVYNRGFWLIKGHFGHVEN